MTEVSAKSLQVYRQHWVANPNYYEETRNKIDEIYWDTEHNWTPQEKFDMMLPLIAGKCEICGYEYTIEERGCPNKLQNQNLPDNANKFQKAHYDSWLDNMRKAARERDNTYLIERNKSPEMIETVKKSWKDPETRAARSKWVKEKHKEYNGMKFCKKCGKETSHIWPIGCLTCHNRTDIMRQATANRNIESWKDPEYAKKISANLGDRTQPNFMTRDNVLFYKDMPWEDFATKIKSGELDVNDYQEIEVKLGVVTYKNRNPLTNDEIIYSDDDFEIRDNVEYARHPTTRNYILWEDLKEKFLNRDPSKFLKTIKGAFPEATIIPTLFPQDSDRWDKHSLFEQSLVNSGIGWLSYVKFDETGRPLVACKSGSLLVNIYGTDVLFIRSVINGPGRRFLLENNLDWDKTKILVIPCKDEDEAFKVESELQINYCLFGS